MKKMKKKTKRIIWVVILLLLLIMAAIYTVVIRPKLNEETISYEETDVKRGNISVSVVESGSVEYEQSVIAYSLNLDISDDDSDDDEEIVQKYLVVEEVYKASGEIVQSGEAILKFDEDSIRSVRKLLASAVADATVDYNDAKSAYELGCLSAEVDYKTQLINKGYATKLYNTSASKIDDNIASIQAEIEWRYGRIDALTEAAKEAGEDYDEAMQDFKDYEQRAKDEEMETDPHIYYHYIDYMQGYLNAKNAVVNAKSTYDNAIKAINDNNEQIWSLETELENAKLTKELESISVKQDYAETKQSGDNAYLVYIAKLESLKEDLKEKEDKLREREEQEKALTELVGEDGIVYAPEEGLIVSVNVSAGDQMTGSKTMISYVCSDDLTITVNVTEEDIVSLAVGQRVDVVFTAYPDEVFEGSIQSINTTATSSDTNTVSYSVVVSLEGNLKRMYGGMTTNVTFTVDSKDDALYISRKALVEEKGSYYVYVKNGLSEYELKKVTIGLKNTSYAEITSGLSENDSVYIRTVGD